MTEWFTCTVCRGPIDEAQWEDTNGVHQGCDENNDAEDA